MGLRIRRVVPSFPALPTERTRRKGQRRGAVLAAVLVCLLAVVLLGGVIVSNLVLHHRQTLIEQQRLQAFWLAESAVDRAWAELQRDSQYTGSVWQVTLDDPRGPRTGVAEIRVEPIEAAPGQRRLQIAARWPDEPVHRYQHHKDLVITLPDSGDSP